MVAAFQVTEQNLPKHTPPFDYAHRSCIVVEFDWSRFGGMPLTQERIIERAKRIFAKFETWEWRHDNQKTPPSYDRYIIQRLPDR